MLSLKKKIPPKIEQSIYEVEDVERNIEEG